MNKYAWAYEEICSILLYYCTTVCNRLRALNTLLEWCLLRVTDTYDTLRKISFRDMLSFPKRIHCQSNDFQNFMKDLVKLISIVLKRLSLSR